MDRVFGIAAQFVNRDTLPPLIVDPATLPECFAITARRAKRRRLWAFANREDLEARAVPPESILSEQATRLLVPSGVDLWLLLSDFLFIFCDYNFTAFLLNRR